MTDPQTANLWIPVLIALIGLSGSGLTALFSYRASKKRIEVETKSALSQAQESLSLATKEQMDTMGDLLDRMRKDLDESRGMITSLKGRVTRMTRLIRDYVQGSKILVAQLKREGLDPDWIPPTDAEIEEALDE